MYPAKGGKGSGNNVAPSKLAGPFSSEESAPLRRLRTRPTLVPQPMVGVVISAHTSSYPEPIEIKQGDTLIVGKRDDEYPGWVWIQAPDKKEGWAPESILEPKDSARGTSTALEDYSAEEMNTTLGERLTIVRELNGWSWVQNMQRKCGWVPTATLKTKI